MQKLAENWRPLRGIAAYLFWAYYRAIKRRDAVPVGLASTETKVA
jgi:DNA-3-methyladenine glycosylase II